MRGTKEQDSRRIWKYYGSFVLIFARRQTQNFRACENTVKEIGVDLRNHQEGKTDCCGPSANRSTGEGGMSLDQPAGRQAGAVPGDKSPRHSGDY